MCPKPKTPRVVERDPVADAAAAANAAQGKANAETAARRKRNRLNSLFTSGQRGSGMGGGTMASAYATAAGQSGAYSSLGGL
jgi:hypothetical protein